MRTTSKRMNRKLVGLELSLARTKYLGNDFSFIPPIVSPLKNILSVFSRPDFDNLFSTFSSLYFCTVSYRACSLNRARRVN